MTSDGSSPTAAVSAPERLLLIPLLVLLGLLPPEARWESMLGVAVCATLLVTLAARRRLSAGLALATVGGAVLAIALGVTSPAPGAAVEGPALFLLAAGVGLAAATDGLAGQGPRALRALAAVGAIAAAHAVYQKLWGLSALAERIAATPDLPDRHALLERTVAGRAFANFSTPAALGAYLALCLPMTFWLVTSARGRGRYAWGALGLLQVVGLLATASATATAALMGALLLAGLLHRGRRVWAAGAVALLALSLVGVVAARGSKLISLTDPNSPWRLRAGNFRSAALMTIDHPWRGVGPGGFAQFYPSYRQEGDNETRHAHNLPLELSAELGLAGGALLSLAFFGMFLLPLVREQPGSWRRPAAIGLAVFALHNLADYTAFMPSLLLTAVLIRGLLSAREGTGSPASGRLPSRAATAIAVVAAVTLSLAGLADDARLAARTAAFAGDQPEAERLAARATRLAPWDVDAAVFRARAASRGTSPEARRAALALAERAVSLSPVNAPARETRARARLAVGDVPGAYADFVIATRLHPLESRYAELRDRLRARLPGGSVTADAGS